MLYGFIGGLWMRAPLVVRVCVYYCERVHRAARGRPRCVATKWCAYHYYFTLLYLFQIRPTTGGWYGLGGGEGSLGGAAKRKKVSFHVKGGSRGYPP